jgi:stage V sporulation protein SpoVS
MAAAVIPINSAWGAAPDEWQHFDLVLGLTADVLPVVSNPNATISPNSSMKALGKTPSRYNAQRQAIGFAEWTQYSATADDIGAWSKERDYGVSLQTRRVRALDVDVPSPEHAQAIRQFIAQRYALPTRVRSASSKFLVIFECAGELRKRSFKCEEGIIEFLAGGNQFVALGAHIDKDGVSRSRYEWDGGLPDLIPVLTREQVEQLWRDLASQFAIAEEHEAQGSVKAQKLADVIANDPVAQFLLDTNRVRRSERDGRLHITCPFEADHTSDSGESATTYFPAHTGGYINGHFQCLHAHCEHRADQEFLDAIEYVSADLASEFSAIADGTGGAAPLGNVGNGAASAHKDAGAKQPSGNAVPVAPAAARFTFQPAHEFAVGVPPAWMVKGVLPQAVLAVLYGESGAGKSFVALDMAWAVATGTPWREKAVKQGRVAYVAAEGAGGFRNRLKAIAQARGVPLEDVPLTVLPDAPNMMEKQDALDVARAIVAAGGAQLVIVDTFAQVMAGANENAGEDVGRALAHCKGIHRATGALVLLVHHSGKDSSRGARGWSGLRAAADVELEVVRADAARSVTVTKMKDGEDGTEYGFRLETLVVGFDADGEEVSSCVVHHDSGTGPSVRRMAKDKGPRGVVEKIVMQAIAGMQGLADGAVDVLELKAAVASQMEFDPLEGKRDTRNQRIDRAIEGLIGAGRLVRNGMQLAEVSG